MAWTNPWTWLAGVKPTAADLNREIRDNLLAIGGPWTAFTPSWQATGGGAAIGNGTLTGAYIKAGGLCIGRIRLTAGTTTTYGTGFYNMGLPLALDSGQFWEAIGTCTVRDTSAGTSWALGAISASTSTMSACTATGGRLGPTVPVTLANTDIVSFEFCYEVA